jgi:putative FmdB family regulatory protein
VTDEAPATSPAGRHYNLNMPLYEYECRDCGRQFETLVRGSETPHCPACAGENLEKALSTFAVSSGDRAAAAAAPGACGSCGDPRGPGACSLN